MRSIRGRVLVIDAPTDDELAYIHAALADPTIHVAFGLRVAPSLAEVRAGALTLVRGPESRREGVRFHILRLRDGGRAVGFFLDFGWDYPTDSTRELDLAFPEVHDRSLGGYMDATVIVAQYLFVNRLAKRLRWRVDVAPGSRPARSTRQGARLLAEFEERHPVSGEWLHKCIYEYAMVDFQALCARTGVNPETTDYGDVEASVWDTYRAR